MMTFLKTILIILLVYYGLKFLLKLAAPYLLRYVTKKAGEKFEEAFGASPFQNEERTEEGKVSIDKIPSTDRTSKNNVGEYVDFEDVE